MNLSPFSFLNIVILYSCFFWNQKTTEKKLKHNKKSKTFFVWLSDNWMNYGRMHMPWVKGARNLHKMLWCSWWQVLLALLGLWAHFMRSLFMSQMVEPLTVPFLYVAVDTRNVPVQLKISHFQGWPEEKRVLKKTCF